MIKEIKGSYKGPKTCVSKENFNTTTKEILQKGMSIVCHTCVRFNRK
jgi:hypothetical protein